MVIAPAGPDVSVAAPMWSHSVATGAHEPRYGGRDDRSAHAPKTRGGFMRSRLTAIEGVIETQSSIVLQELKATTVIPLSQLAVKGSAAN